MVLHTVLLTPHEPDPDGPDDLPDEPEPVPA
jgi:hypothetical protein